MPVDRGSDAFQRFERALDGLKAGSQKPVGGMGMPAGAGSSFVSGRGDGHDLGMKMDDFVQDTAESERDLRSRSRLMPVGIALVILAAFGGVVWYAFSDPGAAPDRQQTVELIQADPDPVKTKPENPGGLQVEHQDKLILNPDPEKPQVERLLPPPEAPLPLASGTNATAGETSGENGAETPAAGADETEDRIASLLRDEREKSAEQAETATESAAETATSTVTAGAAATAAVGNAAVDDARARAESETATPRAAPAIPAAPPVTPKPVAPVVAEAPKAPAAKAPAPKAAAQVAQVPTDSGYVLQLASLRSEELARQEWTRIQNGNKGLLGQMKAIVERAEIDGIGTRYRLQTGPFPTKATAQDLCAQLKAAKQDCLVKRR